MEYDLRIRIRIKIIFFLLPIKVPQGANNLIQWLKWWEAYKDTCKHTKTIPQKNENIDESVEYLNKLLIDIFEKYSKCESRFKEKCENCIQSNNQRIRQISPGLRRIVKNLIDSTNKHCMYLIKIVMKKMDFNSI